MSLALTSTAERPRPPRARVMGSPCTASSSSPWAASTATSSPTAGPTSTSSRGARAARCRASSSLGSLPAGSGRPSSTTPSSSSRPCTTISGLARRLRRHAGLIPLREPPARAGLGVAAVTLLRRPPVHGAVGEEGRERARRARPACTSSRKSPTTSVSAGGTPMAAQACSTPSGEGLGATSSSRVTTTSKRGGDGNASRARSTAARPLRVSTPTLTPASFSRRSSASAPALGRDDAAASSSKSSRVARAACRAPCSASDSTHSST